MAGFTEKTLNAIEKARTKSETARHTIALIIAGAFTFVLFLIWAFILLPFRFDNVATSEQKDSNSPISSLKAQVSGAYDDLMNTVHGQVQKLNTDNGNVWQNQYEKIKSGTQDTQN